MNGKELKIVWNKKEDTKARELGVEYPLYFSCYKEALSAVLDNVEYNKKVISKRREQKATFLGAVKDTSIPLDGSNIIAFIGSRGSGKTTAVNEFCRILCEYHKKSDKWEEVIGHKGQKKTRYRFHVLEPIDASVLATKEDLMEVIFASMHQVFRERIEGDGIYSSNSVSYQKMTGDFDDVFKDYINVGRRGNERLLEETVLVKLKNISGSMKTRAKIEKLIENLLMLLDERNSDDSYLVVTIDDLDMSQENGFEMLEQLHKYLANQKVIILIAIKYEQMKMLCDKYFIECLVPKYGSTHTGVYSKYEKEAKQLSSDYLFKVLPLTNRIYMPERSLLDSCKVTEPSTDLGLLPIKDFVLKKIASKMNMYYDAKGLKKHFCLPDTVRELVVYNDFLDSLFSMTEIEQSDDKVSLYDENHDRFNGDIENRMAAKLLNDDQAKLYKLIMRRNLERRAKYVVNFLRGGAEKNNQSVKIRIADNVDEQNYRYADLLETIYKIGRVNYENKALVHCILASLTSEMVREYYSYINNIDSQKQERAKGRLKCFLGETFGGEWFHKVMPKVSVSENNRMKRVQIEAGYIRNADLEKQIIKIQYTDEEVGKEEETEEIKIENVIKIMSDVVPYMECLTLLFTNFVDGSGKKTSPGWSFEFKTGEASDYAAQLTIKNRAKAAEYDIFGFIGKEIRDEDVPNFEELYQELSMAFEQYLKSELPSEKASDYREMLREQVERKSIWHNYDKKKAVFPYYDLDMSYNIMKRVRTSIREDSQMSEKSIYQYFKTVYNYIAQELKEEYDKYKNSLDGRPAPEFYKNFTEAPFMKLFTDCKEGECSTKFKVDEKRFNDIFLQALKPLKLYEPDINAHNMAN